MADKAISELIKATQILGTDLFVVQQDGTAKCLPGQVLLNWLTAAADGHGGIQSIVKQSTSGLKDTYRITLADTTIFDFVVTNGRAISSIKQTAVSGLTRTYTIAFNDNSSETFKVTDGRSIIGFSKTGTVGLVDTYTLTYNDGTTGSIQVTNGAKGDKGDNAYVWIKYASQQPTEASHSFGDVPDAWIGVYFGSSSTAPTDWQQYKWYQFKGNTGDTGAPATVTRNVVEYQASDSGTIIPSGSWSTSVPVVAQGRYLWTRTTTTFNSGSPAVSYSVSRMGIDGTGSVVSVAGISPDTNGNVPLTASDIGALPNTGGDLTGELRMNGQPISGLNAPTADDQAANKGYVDTAKDEAVTEAAAYTNAAVKMAAPRNLLDNSDFRNPVNQRGFTGGIPADNSYFIDRWKTIQSATKNISLSLSSLGLTVTVLTGTAGIRQFVPTPSTNVTFAVQVNGNVFVMPIILGTNASKITDIGLKMSASWETEYLIVALTAIQTNLAEFTLEWAALYEGEYTAETLPAYQPKEHALELLACQTQLQRFRTESERKTYCEDFRPTMRMTTNGVISAFESVIEDVTYYFASAER